MRCHQSVRSHKRTSCGRVGRGIAGASTAFAAIAAASRSADFAREEGALCGRCWLRRDTAAEGDAAGAECAAEVLGMHGIQGGRASGECGGQACGGLHCVRLVGCGSGGSIRSRAQVISVRQRWHGWSGGERAALCAPQSMSIRSAWKTSSKARQSPPASRDERGMGRAQAYPRLRGKL